MKSAFIHVEGAKLPASLRCRALRVSRSGFYAWTRRPPSRRDVEDSTLVPAIRACHPKSRATYGSPAHLVRVRTVEAHASEYDRLLREILAGRQAAG
jgi:putative transposase